MATREEIQVSEVQSGFWQLRTQVTHVVDGFPPDILHDILEGIVPFELSLCFKKLIDQKYISLESLNKAIKEFPYTFTDKTDRPQIIPKSHTAKSTIVGNAHENWTLLRLLPFLIGQNVPEGDMVWELIMTPKDVVELAMSPRFSEDSLAFFEMEDLRAPPCISDVVSLYMTSDQTSLPRALYQAN